MKIKKFFVALLIILLFSKGIFAQTQMSDRDQAKMGLALSFNALKRYEASTKILEDLSRKYPQDRTIALELAKAWGFGKSFDRAVPLLEKLQQDDPKDNSIDEVYFSVLEANQQFPYLIDQLELRLKDNPRNKDVIAKLAELFLWKQDFNKAGQYYQQLISLGDAANDVYLKLADTYYLSRQYSQAIKIYEQYDFAQLQDWTRLNNFAQALVEQGDFKKALILYEQFAHAFPDNNAVKVTMLGLQMSVSPMDKINDLQLLALLKNNINDPRIICQILDMLNEGGYQKEILHLYDDFLKEQKDYNVRFRLGKVLSWNQRYEEALLIFDHIIVDDPQWIAPRRAKARVLGWMGQYNQAVSEYKKIIEDFAPQPAVSEEAQAKENLYHWHLIKSTAHYEKWLTQEPQDLEGLFDLAQNYSRLKRYPDAREKYQRVLEIYPQHKWAQRALAKNNILENDVLLKSELDIFEADSSSRQVDKLYFAQVISATAPAGNNFAIKLEQESGKYSFYDLSLVQTQKISLEGIYSLPVHWQMKAKFGKNYYANKIDATNSFMVELFNRLNDYWDWALKITRRDVIENSTTFKDNLQADEYQLQYSYHPHRRWNIYGKVNYDDYSDRNIRNDFWIQSEYDLMVMPKRLTVLYGYENYGFSHSDPDYFSPGSFHHHDIGLQWQQWLNKELFWGVDQTFYTLRYVVNLDVHQQRGHYLYADLNREINKRLSFSLQCGQKFYEHQDTYRERELKFLIDYRF